MRTIHTGILLAVEAESAEEAVIRVEAFNENNSQWSDWSEHGGRWADVIPNGVMCYSDNPDKFDEIVDEFRIATFRELEETLDKIGSITLRDLATNPKYDNIWEIASPSQATDKDDLETTLNNRLARYFGLKVMMVVNHRFSQDTYFYDIEDYSIHRNRLDDRIEKEPNKQFIVVWDYHF